MDPASVLAAMEDDFHRERQRVEAAGRRTVTREIGHGLGTVTVDGHGHLRSITVDREAFHMTNEAALARAIVEAVNRVEEEAARLREGEAR